ncbi:MAG: helix-turn-helix transcriptional regulator [Mariprofundaceae bacterium]|nr:helix-turn-helix transcriptional regulator [Mariprofundaceae bacterium]
MKQMDDLEALLSETGELEEVRAMAAKKILAADIRHMMDQRGISKAQLAKSMHTARPVVDRLLDPANTSVTLRTLAKAAAVLGGQLRVEV